MSGLNMHKAICLLASLAIGAPCAAAQPLAGGELQLQPAQQDAAAEPRTDKFQENRRAPNWRTTANGTADGGGYRRATLGITSDWSLSMVLNQPAAGKTPGSDQRLLRDPYGVRAYDNGIVSGARGDSLALQHDLSSGPNGTWQGSVFADTARVEIENNPHSAVITGATLTDAGLEMNWAGRHGWSLNSALEGPVGDTPDTAGHRDFVRAWVRVQKEF